MASDVVTIEIEQGLANRLRAAAEASGESFEAYVRQALEAFSDSVADWAEDADRAGGTMSVQEALAFFDRELAALRATRG